MLPIYLCGPINGCTDSECIGWRKLATELLAPLPVFDPMRRDYRGIENVAANAAKIVDQDKEDIDASAALLVMYSKPSVGTAMEIMYARTERWPRAAGITGPVRLPVHVVNMSSAALSPWLAYHSSAIYKTLPVACEALRRIYL